MVFLGTRVKANGGCEVSPKVCKKQRLTVVLGEVLQYPAFRPREIDPEKSTQGNPFWKGNQTQLAVSSVGLPGGSGLFLSRILGGVEI